MGRFRLVFYGKNNGEQEREFPEVTVPAQVAGAEFLSVVRFDQHRKTPAVAAWLGTASWTENYLIAAGNPSDIYRAAFYELGYPGGQATLTAGPFSYSKECLIGEAGCVGSLDQFSPGAEPVLVTSTVSRSTNYDGYGQEVDGPTFTSLLLSATLLAALHQILFSLLQIPLYRPRNQPASV
ncbi:MAG: hypothetical protein M3Y57_16325 [Acidobacteriota bacterium]|nr:hypothetical protein [Acidobacteriota bacterium]